MTSRWMNTFALSAVAISAGIVVIANVDTGKNNQILNVSYDPARELFKDLNQQFVTKYQRDTGQKWTIQQSDGGSSRQARDVIDGLKADVVSLALFPDVDSLRKRGLIAEGWSKRLPHDSQPFTSTMVFVVRKGNPKHVRDWPDLAGRDVSVVTRVPRLPAMEAQRARGLRLRDLPGRQRGASSRLSGSLVPARSRARFGCSRIDSCAFSICRKRSEAYSQSRFECRSKI